MAFNRYTNITPAKYDARSLQDTLYLPTLKRQQHDQLDTKAAISKSKLDKFDNLGYADDMANTEKDRLNSQMDEFTSDLASQGVNNNSKSKFLDIGSEFSKATSESGMLYKLDQIRKKYFADVEKKLAAAIAAGNDPEQSMKNIQDVYDEMAKNGDPSKLEFIDVPDSPEYYDVAAFLDDFKGDIGYTKYNELMDKGVIMNSDGKFVPANQEVTTQTNILQLEQLNKLAETMLLGEGSKGRATADWNNKPAGQLQAEVNAAIAMKTKTTEITKRPNPTFPTTGGSRSSGSSDDQPTNYNYKDDMISINAGSEKEINGKIGTAQANFEKAKENSNRDLMNKYSYEIRELNRILKDVTTDIDAKYDPKKEKLLNDILFSMEGNTEKTSAVTNALTTEYNPGVATSGFEIKTRKLEEGSDAFEFGVSETRLVKDDKLGYVEKEVKFYNLTKAEYNLANNYKKTKKDLDDDRQAEVDAQLKEYKVDRLNITPTFSSNPKKKHAFNEAMRVFRGEGISPSDIVARDGSGEVIASSQENVELDEEGNRANFSSLIRENKSSFDVNNMTVSKVGNRMGYVFNISPKKDKEIILDEGMLSDLGIDANGSLEFFVEMEAKDLEGHNGKAYLVNEHMNDTNTEAIKRNLKYGNYAATSNESQLGSSYDLRASRATGDYSSKESIDFLQEEGGISVHKVNPNSPGKSQGKLKWGEVLNTIYKSKDGEVRKLTPAKKMLFDIAKQSLTEDEIKAVEKSPNGAVELISIIKDRDMILNKDRSVNKSDISIFLSATE